MELQVAVVVFIPLFTILINGHEHQAQQKHLVDDQRPIRMPAMAQPKEKIQKFYYSFNKILINLMPRPNSPPKISKKNTLSNFKSKEHRNTLVPELNVVFDLEANGGSILSCNTVKCRGGHKCIMTKDECQVPHKSDPFAPTNCASKPRCVPDKICKACGRNEHRSRCSGCEQTCEDPNRKQCKKENICGQNSRCVCDSGFVRNSAGKCVNVLKCPNAPNGVETTTIPEEFIIISKKERNEKHEQIDLLKPRTTINPRSNSPDGNPKHSSKKPVGSKDKPDDGFIIVKEKQNKHRPDGSNQNPTSKPGKKPPKDKSTTQKPNDDGFIIVKEKGNKQKPDGSNPNRTSKPGKNSPKNNKPDKPDDGFIIVKEKGNKQTKRPFENQQNSPTKPTEKPDDGFIVVHEKRKNHHQPSEIKDDEFFVSKKKVQNNKHEQINLM
uniref:TIL domain-containing protein n=1 Tax=Panagrolaimus sp. ES5 TaxID=591445 RepID=A0AC34FEV9_9BILA